MITLAQKYAALEALGYDCDTSGGEISEWRDSRPQPASWESIIEEAEPVIYRKRIDGLSPSPRQIRLALLELGVTPEMVDAQLANNAAAKIEWEYTSFVSRNHPLVPMFGLALGLSEVDLDNLFIRATEL